MTMSITMIQTRMGESGSLLTAGSTCSVSDAFGLAMIGAGYASDTNNVRRQPVNDAGTVTSYTAAQLTALAAAGRLTPYATYVGSRYVRKLALSGSELEDLRYSQAVQAPYKMVIFGDSRAQWANSSTLIGQAKQNVSTERGAFIAGYLGDTMLVGAFGISGDKLITSSSTTGWNGSARSNSKTLVNAMSLRPDVVVVQYGINDGSGATSAQLIDNQKALVSKLLTAGMKVCLQSIMTFDPTASGNTYFGDAPGAAAELVKIQETTAAMSAWMAGMPNAVFVDINPSIALANGYLDPNNIVDTSGVHPNTRCGQQIGYVTAAAIRQLLPARTPSAYSLGPLENPNFIDWGTGLGANTFSQANVVGTMSVSAGTWGIDATTGLPYVECTMTPSALSGGVASALFGVTATGVAGTTATDHFFALNVGDVLQASARVVVDDGADNRATGLQAVVFRCRQYDNAHTLKVSTDVGTAAGTLLSTGTLPLKVDALLHTSPFSSTQSSATSSVAAPASNRGLYAAVVVETTTLAPIRVRMVAPSIRVVSKPQPVTVTAGASPYFWFNGPQPFTADDWVNTGSNVMLTIAPGSGGTISVIELTRGPTVSGVASLLVDTKLTSGVFTLAPGDGVRITWATTAPVLTYTPI
jgi:lysophospholipase L1-like esterase